MKLQIRNWKPELPKPLGRPRLLRILEELEIMRRFKSSKEEFDKGKRELKRAIEKFRQLLAKHKAHLYIIYATNSYQLSEKGELDESKT